MGFPVAEKNCSKNPGGDEETGNRMLGEGGLIQHTTDTLGRVKSTTGIDIMV